MKIGKEMLTQMESTTNNKQTLTEPKQSFNQVVQSQTEKIQRQELQKLMNDITVQGDRLARYRTFQELAKFKRLVKSFIGETVENGLALDSSFRFSMSERHQRLTVVKEIDKKLVTLTDELLDQEKKSVDLLELIGEIEGLLVNLYI